jgi:hypothetical protein
MVTDKIVPPNILIALVSRTNDTWIRILQVVVTIHFESSMAVEAMVKIVIHMRTRWRTWRILGGEGDGDNGDDSSSLRVCSKRPSIPS